MKYLALQTQKEVYLTRQGRNLLKTSVIIIFDHKTLKASPENQEDNFAHYSPYYSTSQQNYQLTELKESKEKAQGLKRVNK